MTQDYINCFVWNDLLPPQYIWEETCGYYALRNGNLMYQILSNINKFDSREKYINNIIKSLYFKNLTDVHENFKNILEYKQIFDDKRDKLQKNDILFINQHFYPNIKPIIYYSVNDFVYDTNNSISYYIIYRKRYQIYTHWIPIIIHKIKNHINIHILDSFKSSWYGDKIISHIISKINQNNDYVITCKDNSLNMISKLVISKIINYIIFSIFIFILLSPYLKKINRSN